MWEGNIFFLRIALKQTTDSHEGETRVFTIWREEKFIQASIMPVFVTEITNMHFIVSLPKLKTY